MRRVEKKTGKTITFYFEDKKIKCYEDDTIASALLASGEIIFRHSSVNATGRGPYCMMGICYECLLKINGFPNQQACMTKVKAGMRVTKQIILAGIKDYPETPGIEE